MRASPQLVILRIKKAGQESFRIALSLLLFATVTIACDRAETPPADPSETTASSNDRAIIRTQGIELHSTLTAEQKRLVGQDLDFLAHLISEAEEGSPFERVFGSRRLSSALQFIQQRIAVLVGPFDLLPGIGELNTTSTGGTVTTLARNLGVFLWYQNLADATRTGKPPRPILLADRSYPPDHQPPRVVQLTSFFQSERRGKKIPSVSRLSTLVHEAVHSECPDGIQKRSPNLQEMLHAPENRACGKIHVLCPEGHDYAGTYSCDDTPDSAHGVESAFALEMAVRCEACSEHEKQIALLRGTDAYSRILSLAARRAIRVQVSP